MNHIKKLSHVLVIACQLLVILIPLSVLYLWIFIDTAPITKLTSSDLLLNPIATPEGLMKISEINWTPLGKILALTANIVRVSPFLLSLISLKAIFKNYKNGDIFVIDNAKQYRNLGFLFFLNALITKPLNQMLMILSATLSNPAGHRYITISFGTPNVEAIFCGVFMIVISWVMLEGSKTNEENRLTI